MKRITIFLLLALLSLSLLAQAAPLKKDLTVSKGVSGRNVIPRMAVNQETGDILVTWTQQLPGTSNLRIWVRLLKHKGDGQYVMKAAKMASASSGWNANSHVVYVPWKKRYLVTWDTFDFNKGLSRSKIMGRLVNTNGKPVKSVITIVDDGRANNWPRAVVLEGQTTLGPPEAVKEVYLTFTAFPTEKGDKNAGLAVLRLKSTFKASSERDIIFPVEINSFASPPDFALTDLDAGVYTTDIQAHRNWFSIAFERQTDGTRYDPFVSQPMSGYLGWYSRGVEGASPGNDSNWLIAQNEGGGGTIIQDPTNADDAVGAFGTTRASLFVRGTFSAEFLDDAYSGDLDGYLLIGSQNDIDGAYLPRNYDSELCQNRNADLPLLRNSEGKRVNAAKTSFGYWVFNAGNNIKTQLLQFKKNGKIVVKKSSMNRVFHGGKLGWLTAEGVFESGVVAIAWQRNVNNDNREIKVHLFD
jgi:hypothetical protein